MTEAVSDRLYELMPAIYRIRDTEEEQALRALFSIIEQEFLAVEGDIEGLYDDWFIETCAEWVVPYIGDLVRVPGLHSGGIGTFSLRAYVANVLAYRRRKGTAPVLEQMARDVSGWPARVVEFAGLMEMTQHINHVRPHSLRTPDLRDANQLELLNGPFDIAAHTAEVRCVVSDRGKYNIPNVGLFLWRLQSYAVTRGEALALTSPADGRYRFDPLGQDVNLFNRPKTETGITQIAEEVNVSGPLRRRPLYEELQARREALAANEPPQTIYFGRQPVFQIYLNGEEAPIAPEAVSICDLSDWDIALPPAQTGIEAQVDPELGRLVIPGSEPPALVEVNYAYGFSSDVGAGPYNRSESLNDLFEDEDQIWWAGVSKYGTGTGNLYASLFDAVTAWNGLAGSYNTGVIAIIDSHIYDEDAQPLPTIILPPGSQLLIIAARYRGGDVPAAGPWSRNLNRVLVADGLRPHIREDVTIRGEIPVDGAAGKLLLNGLQIEGAMTVQCGELDNLILSHCTLVPDSGGLTVETVTTDGVCNTQLNIDIERCICGSLIVPEQVRALRIVDSIIDGVSQTYAIAANPAGDAFSPPTTIEGSTLLGQVYVKEFPLVSDVIFTATARAARLQAGCVRYSYVPPASELPRRFRCQPDLALTERARELGLASADDLSQAEREQVELRIHPVFTTLEYGSPAYAQLSVKSPHEILAGAENGAEMGVFTHLLQPQREANIRTNLQEYLRFGLEAGLFFVN